MAEKNEVLPQETVETPEVNEMTESSVRDIIRNLIADGATRINRLKIKNVNYDKDYEDKNHIRVTITLDRKVPGYVPIMDNNGNITGYEKGMTNLIYTSTFALAAVLKENEDFSWLANHIVDKPKALTLIFNGATIDVLQREFPKGTPVVNPFSTNSNKEWPIYDHDITVNDVINITLGKTGERMAMTLASNILMM